MWLIDESFKKKHCKVFLNSNINNRKKKKKDTFVRVCVGPVTVIYTFDFLLTVILLKLYCFKVFQCSLISLNLFSLYIMQSSIHIFLMQSLDKTCNLKSFLKEKEGRWSSCSFISALVTRQFGTIWLQNWDHIVRYRK